MLSSPNMSWIQRSSVFFWVPSDFSPALQSTPLPLPLASNLPEKLIICHIASVLSRTPMRSSGSPRNNSLLGFFKQGFECGVDHQTWPVNTQSHLDVLQPFWFRPVGTLETRFPFQWDSSQLDNAATLFLSTPNKVIQRPSVLYQRLSSSSFYRKSNNMERGTSSH